ncbi:unnamed protein product [Coffea canephora]|uniref:DH200=94 genomic scaffold, scaffold_1071 n=1 Tax=Coffea canephora TaxID=49390 RepID=A0A068VI51_COFCA|nr:unnamed protein product [Coffea canephora]
MCSCYQHYGQWKEFEIFDRIVYKNKNQHQRCSYCQCLLKVRRDLRLLQSANLGEILNSCFVAIHRKRPKQKVQLWERLKRRRSDVGKYSFLERLLGVARLLSLIMTLTLQILNLLQKVLMARSRHWFFG